MTTPLQQLQHLRQALAAQFPERREVIEGTLHALLSSESVLLLGPPGTGQPTRPPPGAGRSAALSATARSSPTGSLTCSRRCRRTSQPPSRAPSAPSTPAYNPGRADFVPPPHEYAKELMADLVAFVNRTDLPPAVQAAIAHAQFETVHPFADGNGRVGRALIHVVLRRRGLAPRYVPPVSLVLAADAKAYVAALTAFREDRATDWILVFAQALERAAVKASELALRLAELQEKWRERAGRPRRHSSAEALIVELPAHPIVTVATAQNLLDRSKQAVNEAIAVLAERGVLHPITLARRNRAWEARELFELINDVEHELATPDPDEPSRPAPRQRTTSRRR